MDSSFFRIFLEELNQSAVNALAELDSVELDNQIEAALVLDAAEQADEDAAWQAILDEMDAADAALEAVGAAAAANAAAPVQVTEYVVGKVLASDEAPAETGPIVVNGDATIIVNGNIRMYSPRG